MVDLTTVDPDPSVENSSFETNNDETKNVQSKSMDVKKEEGINETTSTLPASSTNSNSNKLESDKYDADLPVTVREVDYDMNPTLLYKFIEYKEWGESLERCKYAPDEASTWVVRYEEESDGDSVSSVMTKTLRWRMLPIHVAIIFNAPLKLVTALSKAYPTGINSTDDRKMLPIHLCCRVLSNINVATFLITSDATTITKTDHRGRTPLKMLLDYREKNKDKTDSSSKDEMKNRNILIDLIETKFYKKRPGSAQVKPIEDGIPASGTSAEGIAFRNRVMSISSNSSKPDVSSSVKSGVNSTDPLAEKSINPSSTNLDKMPTVPSEKSYDNATPENNNASENDLQSGSTTQEQERAEKKTSAMSKRSSSAMGKRKGSVQVREVDYDTYPTKLIKLVEKKKWEEAIQRCVDYPQEASTWMCRLQEVDGADKKKTEVRWRILPLHSAIVLHAPVEVIEALVDAYPDGIKTGDDRQMLPLHMAFRLGASPETAAVLVDAYPDALSMKDSKGHTPLHVLKAYRRKYEKEKKKGKRLSSAIDRNRKDLIHFYLGNRKSRNHATAQRFKDDGTVEAKLPFYNSASDDGYSDSSGNESEDDYDSLFHKDMFADFGRLTVEGFSNIPSVLRDTMQCR